MSERFHFDVGGERLTSFVYAPVKPLGSTLLLGHGASTGQKDPFMVDFAHGLAERGVLVVTYEFPFMAHARRSPDHHDVLEACCRAAIVGAQQCRPKNRLFIGGKSLGGRVASDVVAAGGDEVADLAGIVVLGYPLHPVGKPAASRGRNLRDLQVPMLVVQGTRDVFGTPDELRRVVGTLPRGSEIHLVDGGDHSFAVSRRSPQTQREVNGGIQDEIARWISETASASKAAVSAPLRPRPIASRVRAQLRMLRRSAGSP